MLVRHDVIRASLRIAFGAFLLLVPASSIPAEEKRPPLSGVVVEEVSHGSAGEAAGIKPGDVLLEWSRAANPPANPEEARGSIESPFDLNEVQIEQAPRGRVQLSGTRGTEAFYVTLPLGEWKIEAQPQMPATVLSIYQEGQRLVKAKETGKGIELWRQAAQQAKEEKNGRTATWFYFKAGNALADVQKWDEAHTAYRAAIKEAESAIEERIQAQIWTADGRASGAQNNFQKAELAFRNALAILQRRSSQRLGVAMSLTNLGNVAMNRGDLAAAEDCYRSALTIYEKLAPGSLAVAVSLTNVGRVADARGTLAAAEDSFRKALAIYETLAPESLDCAAILTRLGKVASARGDFTAAEDFHRTALAVYEALAPGSILVASSLNELGNLAAVCSDPTTGEDSCRNALAAHASESFNHAASLTNLGMVAAARGDPAAAEGCYREALAIYENVAPGSLDHAGILTSLGDVARSRADQDEAEGFYRKALAIREQLAPGTFEHAGSLTGLGYLAFDRGDLGMAEVFFRKALAICEKLATGSLDYADSLTGLGDVARFRGDSHEAEEFYRKSLAIRERLAPESLEYADSLTRLGYVAFDRHDLGAAEGFFKTALAIYEKLAPGSADCAALLRGLGAVARARAELAAGHDFQSKALTHIEKLGPLGLTLSRSLHNHLGNVATARTEASATQEFFRKALKVLERLDPLGFFVARSLYNLGNAASARRDATAADELFGESLAILEKSAPGSALEAQALHGAGVLYRRAGRRLEAAEAFCRAIEALELQKGKLGGSEEAKAGFAAQYADYYRDYIEVLLKLDQPGEAFYVLERSRARSLLSMLAERDLVFPGDIPADLERERRLTDADYDRAQSSIATLDPQKDREQIDGLLAHLRELREKQADAAQSIRKASPRLASLQYPQPLGLSGTQHDLDAGTVLLAYSVGRERSFLFTVQSAGAESGLSVFTLSADEKTLRKNIEALRNLIDWGIPVGQGPSTDLVARSRSLYDTLIKPAEALIARNDRILILPDGPLHTLPFGALVRDVKAGKPQYLIEWKPLHTAVSATVYAELNRSRHGSSSTPSVAVAAFGDPRYPMLHLKKAVEQPGAKVFENNDITDPEVRSAVRSGYRFKQLPATRQEVESIANLYAPNAVEYLGEEATEEQAKSLGTDVSLIHFACHAYVNELFPLDSALVLTIPEEPREGQDNGLLQAWEIFEKVRIDADLVTLSACETGLGKEMGGEGLIGLTRAFQYAGARSVLASLWKVEDHSTEELMTRFYAYLKAGKSKDEALRQAQIDLIHSPDLSLPSHWAAFQINGDWK